MITIRLIKWCVIFFGLVVVQGCSVLGLKDCRSVSFYECHFKNQQEIIDTGNFEYHYQAPARKLLSAARIRSLKLNHPSRNRVRNKPLPANQYYSANGHLCHIIDANGSEVVCSVAGRWQASPSILTNSRP